MSLTEQKLIQESEVWSLVAHPNIMPFLGLSFDFHRPGLPCLVSPLYQHGDIIGYLRKNPHINRLSLVSHMTESVGEILNCRHLSLPKSPMLCRIYTTSP